MAIEYKVSEFSLNGALESELAPHELYTVLANMGIAVGLIALFKDKYLHDLPTQEQAEQAGLSINLEAVRSGEQPLRWMIYSIFQAPEKAMFRKKDFVVAGSFCQGKGMGGYQELVCGSELTYGKPRGNVIDLKHHRSEVRLFLADNGLITLESCGINSIPDFVRDTTAGLLDANMVGGVDVAMNHDGLWISFPDLSPIHNQHDVTSIASRG